MCRQRPRADLIPHQAPPWQFYKRVKNGVRPNLSSGSPPGLVKKSRVYGHPWPRQWSATSAPGTADNKPHSVRHGVRFVHVFPPAQVVPAPRHQTLQRSYWAHPGGSQRPSTNSRNLWGAPRDLRDVSRRPPAADALHITREFRQRAKKHRYRCLPAGPTPPKPL